MNLVHRDAATMEFTLALGRADLFPEQKLRVRGFKPESDDIAWLIARTTHTITGAGGGITHRDRRRRSFCRYGNSPRTLTDLQQR